MNLNLTGLGDFAAAGKGKPLELALDDVLPDPDQPRTQFDQAAMLELADSIALRGVKSPISVRPHPTIPGKYIINFGERRYLGSRMAGRKTVPAIVDADCDRYDQVIENLQREDLTPMELASFVQRRLDAGDKKGEIAHRIGKGKDKSFITNLLALVDPPACVAQAYDAGVTSPRTLYDLRALYEKHPEPVAAWCAEDPVITRDTIAALGAMIARDAELGLDKLTEPTPAPPPAAEPEIFCHDKKNEPPAASPSQKGRDFVLTKKEPAAAQPSRSALAKPKKAPATVVIMVEHNGRTATVQESSVVRIVYEGSTEVVEVALSEAVVVSTLEVPN